MQIAGFESSSPVFCTSPSQPPALCQNTFVVPVVVRGWLLCPSKGGHHSDVFKGLLLVVSNQVSEGEQLGRWLFSPWCSCATMMSLTAKRDVPCDSGGRAGLAHLVTLLLLEHVNLFCLGSLAFPEGFISQI